MKYLKLLIAPLCILAFFVAASFVWKWLHLPPEAELIQILKTYFDTYGVVLVFISAILESALVLGIYAPGGTVIFLGVILSGGDPYRAILVVASVIVGFIIGFTFDFYLGKFGWYKLFMHFGLEKTLENMKEKIQKYGISVPWLGYHNPDVGSFIATAYGVLNFSYLQFFKVMIFPVIAWCVFWGTLAYFLGMKALDVMGYRTLIIILGVWVIARIIETKIAERKELSET